MTFLKKSGFSSVGLTLLFGAFCIEWSLLTNGFFEKVFTNEWKHPIELTIKSMIDADFATAAILITYGGVIGKCTPSQFLVVVALETIFYSLNMQIYYRELQAVDMGGSVVIHTFGAYFGIILSTVLSRGMKDETGADINHPKKGTTTTSDLFSMIGTVFLWIYWPSFNGAMAVSSQQHRVVINTILALCSSCFFAFIADAILRPNKKFNIETIQNATLAGGVAVGGSSDLVLGPGGALVLGGIAGIICTFGFTHVQSFLKRTTGLDDSVGIHNLHGMPGLLGGIAGIIASASAAETTGYSAASLAKIFPATAPSNVTQAELLGVSPGVDRSQQQQAVYQLYGLLITLVIATVSGAITGFIVKAPVFLPSEGKNGSWFSIGQSLDSALWYDDGLSFTVDEEEGAGHGVSIEMQVTDDGEAVRKAKAV